MLGAVCMRKSITAGRDECDARSDRRRPCIRVGASKVGGGVAVMKCGLAGRPCALGIYCMLTLFATRPRRGDAGGCARALAHVLELL
jgi:hypothetical protein